jgi:hypothetical protein
MVLELATRRRRDGGLESLTIVVARTAHDDGEAGKGNGLVRRRRTSATDVGA